MNYWLLTTEYPPMHGGGISTYCRHMAEMLAGRNVQVTVIVADTETGDYRLDTPMKNLRVVRFDPSKRSVPPGLGATARLSYAFYRMAATLVAELGTPDLIESQDYLGIAYYLQQFKLLGYAPFHNTPLLVTIHAPAFVYLPYNRVPMHRFPDFWTGEMEKNSIRAADLLLSPSAFMAAEVAKHMDLTTCQPTILPYPYRLPENTRLPASPSKAAASFQRNKIVYYGKLSPQKGSFELLRYFHDLWSEGFPHPLHIIGGTDIVFHPEQRTMGQWLEKEYGEYLHKGLLVLHGKIDPAHIPTALADAHVIVFPSIVDNLPYACIEALGCSKLVLASVQGGQSEIITNGITGFLFDHEEPGSFARQLKHVLQLPDEDVCKIGTAARHSLDRYAYDTIAPKKLALLQQLKAGWRPPHHYPFLYEEPSSPQAAIQAEFPHRPAEQPGDLLSIVIPFYNLGPYLNDCIRSVLASTWKPLEVLVVNDGSTDAESRLALLPWRDHPQVRIIDQPNKGLAETRNTGARQASGRFLAFLDADDMVSPDYYEKAIRVLLRYKNVHFAGCWVQYFGEAHGTWPSFPPAPPYLLAHNTLNSSALVYKRRSFLAAGLNDSRLVYGLEDYESVIAMTRRSLNGIVLPECLHRYRVRQHSMFRRMSREKALWSYHYILQKHRPWYERFAADLIPLLNGNGPSYLYENPTLEVFVSSSIEKPGSWQSRLKNLARRNRTLKLVLLTIKRKLWQTS